MENKELILNESDKKTKGGIPEEELKAKYGNVITLEIPKDAEGAEFAYAYLRKPDRLVMSEAMAKMTVIGGGNTYEASEGILKRCLIAEISDPIIMQDDDMYVSAVLMCQVALNLRIGEIKKNY